MLDFLKSDEGTKILGRLSGSRQVPEKKKQELFTMFWMFVHGMAALIAGRRVEFSDKEIKTYITKAYEGFVAGL